MEYFETLIIIDHQPPFEDTLIEFNRKGFVQILTGDEKSDGFTLTKENAQQIIDWLTEWKELHQ